MKLGKIYYVIPDIYRVKFSLLELLKRLRAGRARGYLEGMQRARTRPVGGVKMHYIHCMQLREQGYDAVALVMGPRDGNFFGFDVPTVSIKEVGYRLEPHDVVVSTEYLPYDGLRFSGATRVVFVQNWINVKRRLKPADANKSYLELGYQRVLVCGSFLQSYLRTEMGIDSSVVTNGIDHQVFYEDEAVREPGRILCLPRKKPHDLAKIQGLVRQKVAGAQFVAVDGLSENEIAAEYRKSDIFLATGYPEGFGLPALEAMRSGAAVVGFSGQGGLEFMHHERSALIADDGDCEKAAEHLVRVLLDPNLKEKLRSGGREVSKKYSLLNMKAELLSFFGELEQQGSNN